MSILTQTCRCSELKTNVLNKIKTFSTCESGGMKWWRYGCYASKTKDFSKSKTLDVNSKNKRIIFIEEYSYFIFYDGKSFIIIECF